MKFGVVTEVSTFLVITQVSSGLKKSHIFIFSKYKYLLVMHAIASLANVKSCVTVGIGLGLGPGEIIRFLLYSF